MNTCRASECVTHQSVMGKNARLATWIAVGKSLLSDQTKPLLVCTVPGPRGALSHQGGHGRPSPPPGSPSPGYLPVSEPTAPDAEPGAPPGLPRAGMAHSFSKGLMSQFPHPIPPTWLLILLPLKATLSAGGRAASCLPACPPPAASPDRLPLQPCSYRLPTPTPLLLWEQLHSRPSLFLPWR